MIHTLQIAATIAIGSLFVCAGCSSKKDTGTIKRSQMFPPTNAISDECTIDKQMSDKVAVQISEGLFDDASERNASNTDIVQCSYKNPNFILTLTHFESAEACKEAHLKDGIGFAKKLKGFQEVDWIGEGCYVADFAGESIGFRYGNINAVITSYDEADRDAIVKALNDYYASVVD